MAKIENSSDPDILKIKKGGEIMVCLIGILFLLPIFIPDMHKNPRNNRHSLGITLFSTAATICILGRAGITFNRREKTIVKWFGLLFPIIRINLSWEEYRRIFLIKELRRQNRRHGKYTVYVARIYGADAEEVLTEDQNYLKVRRIAKAVASFMQLPLTDSSTSIEVTRQPFELDESLRDRLRRTNKIARLKDLPATSKIQCSIEKDILYVTLPKNGWGCLPNMILFGGICATIVGYYLITPQVKYFFIFLILSGFISMFMAWIKANTYTEIYLSKEKFRIKKIDNVYTKVEEFKLEELEELLFIARSDEIEANNFLSNMLQRPHLLARSDYKVSKFGESLTPSELSWLLATLENKIAT